MLTELKEKARLKKVEVDNDKNASERDKRLISSIFELLSKERSFNDVPGSTVLAIFRFLNVEGNMAEYVDKYHALMDEVNKRYTYVDPETIKKWEKGSKE